MGSGSFTPVAQGQFGSSTGSDSEFDEESPEEVTIEEEALKEETVEKEPAQENIANESPPKDEVTQKAGQSEAFQSTQIEPSVESTAGSQNTATKDPNQEPGTSNSKAESTSLDQSLKNTANAKTASSAADASSQGSSGTDVDEIIFWSSIGVAGAGLITGSILGGLAISEQSNFKKNPTTKRADHGERLALFADVSFGFAAVAGATAAMIYLSDSSDSDTTDSTSEDDNASTAADDLSEDANNDASDASNVSWHLTPALSPNQAALFGEIRF